MSSQSFHQQQGKNDALSGMLKPQPPQDYRDRQNYMDNYKHFSGNNNTKK
jgi:hypothetical protein